MFHTLVCIPENLVKNSDSRPHSRNSDSVISRKRPEERTLSKSNMFQILMSSELMFKNSGLRWGEERGKKRSFIGVIFDKETCDLFHEG